MIGCESCTSSFFCLLASCWEDKGQTALSLPEEHLWRVSVKKMSRWWPWLQNVPHLKSWALIAQLWLPSVLFHTQRETHTLLQSPLQGNESHRPPWLEYSGNWRPHILKLLRLKNTATNQMKYMTRAQGQILIVIKVARRLLGNEVTAAARPKKQREGLQ